MKRNLIFGLVLAAVAADFGCSRGEVAAKAPPVKVEEVSDVNLLTVAHPEQFALVSVATRQMRDQLNVNGVVAPDVNRGADQFAGLGARHFAAGATGRRRQKRTTAADHPQP